MFIQSSRRDFEARTWIWIEKNEKVTFAGFVYCGGVSECHPRNKGGTTVPMIHRKAAGNDEFMLEYMNNKFSQCLCGFGYRVTWNCCWVCESLCLFPHKWTPVILMSITRCTFVLLRVSAVIDVQAFERLLGSCKEIMKRNIAHYEEQLVALFGSSMDLRDWASHTTLCAFYYDVTTYTMTHRRTQTIWAQIKLLHESGRPRRSWLTCTCINTYTVWMHLYTHTNPHSKQTYTLTPL